MDAQTRQQLDLTIHRWLMESMILKATDLIDALVPVIDGLLASAVRNARHDAVLHMIESNKIALASAVQEGRQQAAEAIEAFEGTIRIARIAGVIGTRRAQLDLDEATAKSRAFSYWEITPVGAYVVRERAMLTALEQIAELCAQNLRAPEVEGGPETWISENVLLSVAAGLGIETEKA